MLSNVIVEPTVVEPTVVEPIVVEPTVVIKNKSVTQDNKTCTTGNRGTGAGGANTNKNGLPWEDMTDLQTHCTVVAEFPTHKQVKFGGALFSLTKKNALHKYMFDNMDHTVTRAHGCKQPDECLIDESNKLIFIIEKKFQQHSGSVCEKIQTSDCKIWSYGQTFPKYTIVYMYCLSNWFEENCVAELQYLKHKGVPVFWGNDSTYKTQILDYIMTIRYKCALECYQEKCNNPTLWTSLHKK